MNLQISIAALIAALILVMEHYMPWRPILGRGLRSLERYILGVLALILPMSGLLAVWTRWIELAALWVIVVVGGISVMAMYALDLFLIWRARAQSAEEIEGRLRDGTLK